MKLAYKTTLFASTVVCFVLLVAMPLYSPHAEAFMPAPRVPTPEQKERMNITRDLTESLFQEYMADVLALPDASIEKMRRGDSIDSLVKYVKEMFYTELSHGFGSSYDFVEESPLYDPSDGYQLSDFQLTKAVEERADTFFQDTMVTVVFVSDTDAFGYHQFTLPIPVLSLPTLLALPFITEAWVWLYVPTALY